MLCYATAVDALDLLDRASAVTARQYRTLATTKEQVGPLIVFIVAGAVLLALAATLATGAAIYCMSRGGNLEWYQKISGGWRVWDWKMRLACRMR